MSQIVQVNIDTYPLVTGQARRIVEDLDRRERFLQTIRPHHFGGEGIHKPIRGVDLVRLWELGSDSALRAAISWLQHDGVQIGSTLRRKESAARYYWALTAEDLSWTVLHLRSRITRIENKIVCIERTQAGLRVGSADQGRFTL